MYFFEDLYITCEDCSGKRYGPQALSVRYRGKNIHDVLEMTVDEAGEFFSGIPQVRGRLELMRDVGLGYLRLGQPATTLSGGEAQRLKLCSDLGSAKVSRVLYILDEPTVGLHPRDVGALLGVLNRLVDAGNTVLVIEHNLIDLGPEGGEKGGRIICEGAPEQISRKRSSYTGRYLKEVLKG
jgi:excinuclease ABC subunit A